jgi:hypothetical protein
MASFPNKQERVMALTGRSFLTEANKRAYWMLYQTKRNMLIA